MYENGARKNDTGKPRIDLVPVKAVVEVAKVLTDGAKEYGDHNWRKGIVYSRLYSAIQRHLLAFWSGEDIDKSGHRALAHACTDIMMLMEMDPEWDDRYLKPDKLRISETDDSVEKITGVDGDLDFLIGESYECSH